MARTTQDLLRQQADNCERAAESILRALDGVDDLAPEVELSFFLEAAELRLKAEFYRFEADRLDRLRN